MSAPYQLLSLTLSALQRLTKPSYGSYVRIISCSLSGVNPIVRIGSSTDQEIQPGIGIKLKDGEIFSSVEFYNPSATDPMTIKYAIGDGYIDDSSLTLAGATVFDSILDQLKGSSGDPNWGLKPIAATPTKIADANMSRRSIKISNLPTNRGFIILGYNNTLSIGKFFEILYPGDVYAADDTLAAIYGLAEIAGENVSLSEV